MSCESNDPIWRHTWMITSYAHTDSTYGLRASVRLGPTGVMELVQLASVFLGWLSIGADTGCTGLAHGSRVFALGDALLDWRTAIELQGRLDLSPWRFDFHSTFFKAYTYLQFIAQAWLFARFAALPALPCRFQCGFGQCASLVKTRCPEPLVRKPFLSSSSVAPLESLFI